MGLKTVVQSSVFQIKALRGLFLVLLFAGLGEASPQSVTPQEIPGLRLWQSNMQVYGRLSCERLIDRKIAYESKLSDTYYDAIFVFKQIRDYTGDPAWDPCIAAARSIYRDRYVLRSRGVVPGYWNFTRGLTKDSLETGDRRSRAAVLALARRAAFARDGTPLSWSRNARTSREVAYAIDSYLNAEELTGGRRARLEHLVDQALGHMDQWFVTHRARYVRPFMVGLTAYALIRYYEKTGDARIPPVLQLAADQLWETLWVPSAGAFRYTNYPLTTEDFNPAPDLNLLIAPLYGWLYYSTGETRFLDRGDLIFVGGVEKSWLGGGKQFDQNYMLSFRYVEWRSLVPESRIRRKL